MNNFIPLDFFGVLNQLEDAERILRNTTPTTNLVTQDLDTKLKIQVEFINREIRPTLELGRDDEVTRQVNYLQCCLLNRPPYDNSVASVLREVIGVRRSIEHAFTQRVFLCIPPDHACFYNQEALFGGDIATKFPEINKELRAAGNCFAAESYTACVFHLGRVVEIAARVLVAELQVEKEIKNQGGKVIPVKFATWEQLLMAFDVALTTLRDGISTDETKRETYEFYNHAISQFRNFKDAWRNKVSHKRVTYQEGKTKDIRDNVKAFLDHLSERLSEPVGATFD